MPKESLDPLRRHKGATLVPAVVAIVLGAVVTSQIASGPWANSPSGFVFLAVSIAVPVITAFLLDTVHDA